ncbi:MAG: hypothetical protein ACKO9Q_32180, partial [Pirellula sp.]
MASKLSCSSQAEGCDARIDFALGRLDSVAATFSVIAFDLANGSGLIITFVQIAESSIPAASPVTQDTLAIWIHVRFAVGDRYGWLSALGTASGCAQSSNSLVETFAWT